MVYSAARARWRAKLDFYAAAGVVLPEVHPINDEDVAAMQRPAPSPAEQATRPTVTAAPTPARPRPALPPSFPGPDVSPARPMAGIDLPDIA